MINNDYDIVNYSIYSINEIVENGKELIPERHRERISNIKKYKMLYGGDRDTLSKHYKNELIKYGVFKENNYNAMMILANYCKKSTNDLLETSISSPPVISSEKKQENKKMQEYLTITDFNSKIYQILTNIHITGNCFVRVVNNGIRYVPQILDTEQVYVVSDLMTDETTSYIVFTPYIVKENGRNLEKARILVAEVGKDTVYDCFIENGKIEKLLLISETKTPWTDDFSIINFLVTPTLNNPNYGISAYSDADDLQSNLIRNMNTVEVVVEKFAQPILTGPSLNEQSQNNESYEDNGFVVIPIDTPTAMTTEAGILGSKTRNEMELTGSYVANDSEKELKFVEYKGAINETMNFIDLIKKELIGSLGGDEMLDFSRDITSIDSSKAYRMFFLRLLNTCDKYTNAIVNKLKNLVSKLTETRTENISIKFQAGLPEFPDELVAYAKSRLDSGTFSIVDAIAYIDGISKEEAEKKAQEIKEYDDIKDKKEEVEEIKNENINEITNEESKA